jgi:hypothetical protein
MVTSDGPQLPDRPWRAQLSGLVRVPAGISAPLSLFTPRGEQAWAEGWDPRFPAPGADDSEPGMVFETGPSQHTVTWVVCAREPGQSIRYARIIPGQDAGTVTVTLGRQAGWAGPVATVSYDLTALSEEAASRLARFAADFPQFLRHWEQAIAAMASPPG